MDRFIVQRPTYYLLLTNIFKIQYGQIYSVSEVFKKIYNGALKSNMDRFIAREYLFLKIQRKSLKSNMDRFIGTACWLYYCTVLAFKIQYGQIYSYLTRASMLFNDNFKIQYGQIYRKNLFYLTKFFKALKSNMDRFIASSAFFVSKITISLKSNMDRFIDRVKLI